MASLPTVLYPLTLPRLLHHVLAVKAPSTTLVICSSREIFLQHLLQSLEQDQSAEQEHEVNLQDLVPPSLHNLFTTRHVKLTFCATVQSLLAYLTAYGRDGTISHTKDGQQKARLLLVNSLALHAPTPSFSAQGLSRAFAAAVETAQRTGAEMQLVECEVKHKKAEQGNNHDVDMDLDDRGGEENHVEGYHADEEGEGADPWDQEVSILNVSARRYGSNNEDRAWAGRTLKVKSIAARWFRFQRLGDGDGETHENAG